MVENDYVHGKKEISRLAEMLRHDEPFDPHRGASPMYAKNKHFGYIYQRKGMHDPVDKIFSPYPSHLF